MIAVLLLRLITHYSLTERQSSFILPIDFFKSMTISILVKPSWMYSKCNFGDLISLLPYFRMDFFNLVFTKPDYYSVLFPALGNLYANLDLCNINPMSQYKNQLYPYDQNIPKNTKPLISPYFNTLRREEDSQESQSKISLSNPSKGRINIEKNTVENS